MNDMFFTNVSTQKNDSSENLILSNPGLMVLLNPHSSKLGRTLLNFGGSVQSEPTLHSALRFRILRIRG